MKRALSLALAAALIGLVPAAAFAQAYPSRTVTVVVPFPAGGSVDGVARILVQKLNETVGQHFIVENRAGGASGIVGANMVAKSPPDGYTLLESASVHVINPLLYKNVPYDVVNDFTPIMLLAVGPLIVSTPPNVPANNLKELFDLVRKDPKKYTFGTTSIGSASHLAIELLKREAKLDTLVVALQGHGTGADRSHERADPACWPTRCCRRCRWRRARRPRRSPSPASSASPSAPEIPTVEESAGFKGFEFVSWYGLWAPKNLPADVSQKLQADVAKVLALPEMKERLAKLGFEAKGGTAEDFTNYIGTEMAKYEKIIKDAKIKVE